MSKVKSMELGLNQNIKYKGVVYHIQSEDGGKQNPVLTTHLFIGGVILSTRRDNYDPTLESEELTAVIKKIIATHYRALLMDLKEGKIAGGENYVAKSGATKPGEGTTSAPTPPPAQATPPTPAAPAQATPPTPAAPAQATPPTPAAPAQATPAAPVQQAPIESDLKMPSSFPDAAPVSSVPSVEPAQPVAPTPQAPAAQTPVVEPPPVQTAPVVVEDDGPIEILDIEDIILDGPSSDGPAPSTGGKQGKVDIDDLMSGGNAPKADYESSGGTSPSGKKKKTIDEIILEHLSLDD